MKKVLAVFMLITMLFAMTACAEEKTTADKDANKGTVSSVETAEPEEEVIESEEVAVGNKIETDFVEMTITEAGIASSLKTSIKSGYITRTFGPEDAAESEFVYVKGTIMNKSTSNCGDDIVSMAKIGDYNLEEDGMYVYKSDGDTVYELAPLTEYNFMMYVSVPNALIENLESCDYNFGFSEGMDNTFAKFDEVDYKYTLKITPEK